MSGGKPFRESNDNSASREGPQDGGDNRRLHQINRSNQPPISANHTFIGTNISTPVHLIPTNNGQLGN